MQNEFQVLIEAILDKTKIPKDAYEIQKLIKKYPAEFEAKLKTSNLKKDTTEVKNIIASLASKMNIKLDDKQISSVLNSFISKTQQLETQIQKTVTKIKELQITGKIDLDFSSVEKYYQFLEKIGSSTGKLKTDFSQLKVANDALSHSATDNELITNYTKFNSTLNTVKNSLKQVKLSSTFVNTESLQLEKITLKNQIQAWNRINSNAKQFHAQMNKIIAQVDSIDDDRNGLSNLRRQFQSLNAEAAALGVKGFSNIDKFKNATSKFSEWLAPSMLIMEGMQQLKKGVGTIVQFDDAMTDVAYTSDITASGLENLSSKSMQMAKNLNTSASNILEAVKIYSTAQSTADDILRKAQPAIMLSNASGMSGSESSKTINTSLNQFELEDTEEGLLDIVDTLQYVSSQLNYDFTAGIKEVNEGIEASGNVAHIAGLSMQEYAAMVGLAVERTGQSGSTIGK